MLIRLPDGRNVLSPDRIVSRRDIERAMERQGLPAPEPGDAVPLRTGSGHLIVRCHNPLQAEGAVSTVAPATVIANTSAGSCTPGK